MTELVTSKDLLLAPAPVVSGRRLVSVPENAVVGDLEEQETNQRLIGTESQNVLPEEMIVTAEPVTASQQISLWILRKSLHDISQEWSAVGSIRNLLVHGSCNTHHQQRLKTTSTSSEAVPLRKCATDVKFRIESDFEDEDDETSTNVKNKTRKLRKFSTKGEPNNFDLKYQSTAPGKLCDINKSISSLSGLNAGIRPVNRFRSRPSFHQCSKCSSQDFSTLTSRSTSQMSLLMDKRECKICLLETDKRKMLVIETCGCEFCSECLSQYASMEILSGVYSISCPDPQCSRNGSLSISLISQLVNKDILEKHQKFRLNTEVNIDDARTWCPAADCQTICHICPGQSSVTCHTCQTQFCPTCHSTTCHSTSHPGFTCQENQLENTEFIKRCPMCHVPIERDAGCAQMMCRRCKHVFCWYCMASLDGDFLLRHYDSGECRGKLGHSRTSVVLHRVQVVAIFALFGVLLLVAAPVILAVSPVFLCCKCCCKMKTGANGD